MMLWLFFTIFGLVLFVPTTLIFLLLNRFKNTIKVLFKENGALISTIITDKQLEEGYITQIKGKKIVPIPVCKEDIYFGKWRRWIIKSELHSNNTSGVTDKEVEEYLNNEDLLKLYLAGKFKDTLIMIMVAIILCIIAGHIINGFQIHNISCLKNDNTTRDFIIQNVRLAFNITR